MDRIQKYQKYRFIIYSYRHIHIYIDRYLKRSIQLYDQQVAA